MSKAGLQFRHVAIETSYGQVYGICLAFSTREAAEEAFAVFHRYITAPSGIKSVCVAFTSDEPESFEVTVDVVMPGLVWNARIEGVNAAYVHLLRNSLDVFAYYVLLAGYEAEDGFRLLSPADYHMFKRDVVIDGETVYGQSRNPLPWTTLFKGSSQS
jgi:hypothetical protein